MMLRLEVRDESDLGSLWRFEADDMLQGICIASLLLYHKEIL